jgi:hypothetical protein
MKRNINSNLVTILFLLLAFFYLKNVIAQEKTKKQIKEEAKIEKQKQIESLVESKEFVFVASRVVPQGGRTVNLTTEYTVEIHPDFIKSDLPFFGRAYSGVGYGGDSGMKFEGKPKEFSIEKAKKAYIIKAEVKGESDIYTLLLSVYYDGYASLSISSNNRSSISYNGVIEKFKKK